jgi:hypothetical protein
MSRRAVAATSRFLARRSPRRGFLAKSAVVGSAMAVAPKNFITKPATAYAQVCNCNGSSCSCSQLCCDGYTEFCCTIYGTNGCPPGSLYGGWWRVSGSNYCGGSNRYYLDCHNPCDGCGCGASGICSGSCNGTPCGCALGSCKNRKAGCTHFRYGQCNQQDKCLGPIVCRVITCTPPWQLDPTCSTSIRTDEATRNHNRQCLTETGSLPVGGLDVVDGQPGTIRVRGWAIDPDAIDPISVTIYVNGNLTIGALADETRSDVGAAYRGYGNEHGFDISLASTIGTKEVCVYAVNEGGGTNTLLGCKTVRVSAGAATGLIESAVGVNRMIEISGWAMAEGSSEVVDVDLYLNDVHRGKIAADRDRSDLVTTFSGAGANHGFSTVVAADPGSNTVCATVTNPEDGEVIGLGCTTVSVGTSERPHGAIDKVKAKQGAIRVIGWVLDPDGGHAEVAIMVDGTEVHRAACTDSRPDVAMVYPSADETGGFDIEVSAAAGDHNVCVYTYGSDGEDGPLLGCVDVTVA